MPENDDRVVVESYLESAQGRLRLAALTNGWARCYWLADGVETFLGAETLDDFVARFTVVLTGGRFPGAVTPN